jgi:hypothetical protein
LDQPSACDKPPVDQRPGFVFGMKCGVAHLPTLRGHRADWKETLTPDRITIRQRHPHRRRARIGRIHEIFSIKFSGRQDFKAAAIQNIRKILSIEMTISV